MISLMFRFEILQIMFFFFHNIVRLSYIIFCHLVFILLDRTKNIETESSFWRFCRHWLYRKLALYNFRCCNDDNFIKMTIFLFRYSCNKTAAWAPSQYPKTRLSVRSRKVSKPRFLYLQLSDRSEIRQCCRCACQISKRYGNLKYQSRGFESLQDPTKRRLFGYWDGALAVLFVLF